ncbi:MAG: hypothetical protein KBC23_00680 [Candidatus Omnitrophica bacterium]|nr:hypothetical protein [Candidatus Omnitrophota bacterium]
MFKRIIALLICFCFISEQTGYAQVAGQFAVPAYLSNLAPVADRFRPVQLRSIEFDPSTNNFQLLLDQGDLKSLTPGQAEESSRKLFEYFKIGLALPNSMFWVNLRPDSPDNVIDPYLEKTDLGKVLLEADLQLKKDLARFTNPDTPEGRQYWNKLYEKAEQTYSGQDIEIPTFTRPWIVPGEIIIRETPQGVFIYKATLQVMLEQDYIKDSPFYNFDDPNVKKLNEYSSDLVRQLIIPKLTREVNSSKRYAELRQVYYSLILAQWFKSKNEDNPVIDGKDLNGLASKEAWSKASCFNAYKRSFSEGEYRKEETINSPYGVTIRQYFSGGIQVAGGSLTAIPSSSLDNREYVSDFIIQNLSIGDKKGSVPRDGGNQSRGEDENDTRIPYDDEVRQAKDFLAAQGYSEIQIAGWLARGRAKLLEIAEEAGFQFSQADGSQSRRDGGEEDIIGELILPPGSKSVRLFSAPPEKNIRSKILATVYATGFRDKNDPETRIVWFRPAEAKEFSALQSNAIAESLAQANKEIKIRLGMSVQDSLEQLLSKHYLIVGRRLVIMQADGTILTAPIQEATYDRLQLIMNREQGSGRAGGFYNRDYMKHQDLRNPRGRLLTDLEETKADLLSPQHEDAVQRDGGTGDHAEAVRQQRELVQEYFDARGIDSLPEEIPANGLRALADDIRGKKHALIEQIIPLMLAHYGIPSQRKLRRFKDLMAGDLRAWTYGDLLLLRDDLRNWKIQEGMVSANTPQPQGMLSRRFKTLAVFAFFVVPSFFIGGFVHAYVSGMADDHTSDPLGPDMQPLHLTTFNHIEKIPYSTDYTSFFLSEPEGLTDNTSHPVSISLVVNPLPDLYLEQQNASYVKTHDVPLLLVVNGNAVQNLSRYLNEYTLYGARDGHIIEILDITGRDPKAIAEYLNDKGRMGYQIGFVGDQVDVLSGVPADHDELQDLEALRDEVNDLVREYRNTHKDTRDIDKELLKHRDLTDQSFSAQVSMVGMIQRGEKETRPEEWNELRERHARLQADLRQAEEELGPIIPAASRFKEFLFEKEEAGAIDRYIQAGNDPQALFPDTYTEREAFHWSSYLAQGAFNSIKVYKTAGAMHAPQDSGAIKDIQKTRALRTVLEKELGAYKEKYGVAFQQDYEAFEAQIPDAHTIVSMDLLHNEPNEQWTKEKRTDMYQILDLQSFLGQAGYDSVYQAADGRIYESEEAFRAYEDYVLFREHALERWEKEPDVAHAVIWLYLIEPDLARTAMSGNVSITLVDELPLPNPWAEGMALPRIGFPHVLVKGADIYILKDSFDSYSTDLRVRIVAHESSHAVNEIHAYNDAGPFGVLRWALWYMLNPGDEEKRVRMREQKVGNISGKVIDPYFSDRIDRLDPDEHKYLIEKINEAREDSAPDSNSTDIFPAEVQRTYELTTRGALFGLFLGPAALLTRMRAVKSRLVWFARRAFGQEDIADRMRILSREAKIVEKTIEFAVPPVEARMNGQRAIEENNKFLALVDSVMEDTILFGLKYKEPFTIRFREFFGNGNGFEGNMATITETTLKTLIRKLAVNGYDAVATFHDREYMGKIGCADRPIPEKVRLTFAAHWATHPQTGKESLRITIADNGAGLFAADTRHKSFVEGSNLYFGGAGLDTRMISKGDSATGAQGLLAYLWGLAGVTIPKNQDNEDATEQFYSLTYGDDGWGATVTVWLPRECLVQRDGGTGSEHTPLADRGAEEQIVKIVDRTIGFLSHSEPMDKDSMIKQKSEFVTWRFDSLVKNTILADLEFKKPFIGDFLDVNGKEMTIFERSLQNLILRLVRNSYDAVATFHDREYMEEIGHAAQQPPVTGILKLSAGWVMHNEKESLQIRIKDNGAGTYAADTRRKELMRERGFDLYFGGSGIDVNIICRGDSQTGSPGLLASLWREAGVPDAEFSSVEHEDAGGTTVTIWLPRECLVQRDGGTERPAAQRDDDKSNETARFDQQADDIREKIRKIFDASKETWKDPKLQLTEEVLERYFRQVLRKFNIGTTEEVIWRMVQKHMNKSIKKEIILIRHSVESSVSQQRRMEENDVLLTDFLNAIHVNPPVPYDVKFVPGHIVEKYVGVYSAGYFPFHQTYVIPSELDGPLLTMLLLHEGLHHNSRGLRSIGKILDEGVTEYAAWKIATSSLKDFLIDAADTNYPLDLQAQELERKVLGVKNSYAPALFLACRVIEAVGEDVVFEAYFKGNIKVLIAALGKDAIRQLKGLDKLKPYDEKIMPQVPKIIDAIEKNQASHNDTQRPKVQLDGGEVRDIDAQQQDLAGIDFRALHGGGQPQQAPVMMPQAMLEMQQLARNSKIQDLDAEWKAIEAQMRAKEMPYARMKEYVAVCVCRPDAGEHLEKTARCILNILRLEEEQGLATRTELTDILVCIG